MLWIQENSRCRECRCSCWAEFGQAFSMLNGKFELLTLNRTEGSQERAEVRAGRSSATPKQRSMQPALDLGHTSIPDDFEIRALRTRTWRRTRPWRRSGP